MLGNIEGLFSFEKNKNRQEPLELTNYGRLVNLKNMTSKISKIELLKPLLGKACKAREAPGTV